MGLWTSPLPYFTIVGIYHRILMRGQLGECVGNGVGAVQHELHFVIDSMILKLYPIY